MEGRQTPLTVLLEKYLRNECGADDLDQLRLYLETQEGKLAFNRLMDQESPGIPDAAIDPEVSAGMLEKIQTRIPDTNFRKTNPFFKTLTWRIAATLTGLLFLAVMGWWLYPDKNTSNLFSTTPGQKRTIVLSDGSLVTLNGNSSFVYHYTPSRRHVELKGEAYFDVKRDTLRPFFVKTSEIEIAVLGTAFNVKSYAENDVVETTLVRGRVEVKNLSGSRKNEVLTLAPREQALFNKRSQSLDKKSAETTVETLWHEGNLEFEDEPLRRIIPELEKWYRVKIEWDQRSADCRFSMNIGEETLDEVLRLFETTSAATIRRVPESVRIEGNLCE